MPPKLVCGAWGSPGSWQPHSVPLASLSTNPVCLSNWSNGAATKGKLAKHEGAFETVGLPGALENVWIIDFLPVCAHWELSIRMEEAKALGSSGLLGWSQTLRACRGCPCL